MCNQKHTTGGSASLQNVLCLGGKRKCTHTVTREQLQGVRRPCSRWYRQVWGASSEGTRKVRERSFLRKRLLELGLQCRDLSFTEKKERHLREISIFIWYLIYSSKKSSWIDCVCLSVLSYNLEVKRCPDEEDRPIPVNTQQRPPSKNLLWGLQLSLTPMTPGFVNQRNDENW